MSPTRSSLLPLALLASLAVACGKADSPASETAKSPLEMTSVPLIGEVVEVPVGGPAMAPRFYPDGQALLVAGVKYAGLRKVPLNGGTEVSLTDEAVGYWATFDEQGLRTVDAKGRELRLVGDGWQRGRTVEPSATRVDGSGMLYFQAEDRIYATGTEGTRVVVESAEERYYRPQLSPNGKRLLVQGLYRGLYLLDVESDELRFLCPGGSPTWMPDSRRVLFDRSTDDGVRILSSELFVIDVESGEVTQLTDTPDRHEMRPSPSPDGTRIAFDADWKVYVADLK